MIRYSDNWTPPTELTGAQAASRYDEESASATTVEVSCGYTGNQSLQAAWGQVDDTAFIALRDSAAGSYFASGAKDDAGRLYQALLSELVKRQWFVNPDPRSPEHFSPERGLDEIAEEINSRFGTSVAAEI